MGSWAVGLSTGSFYRTSIFDVLEGIRDYGFCLIEISGYLQHLDYHAGGTLRKAADMIHRLDLRTFSFHAPFGSGIDITSPDDRQREDSVEEILTSVKAASFLGAQRFVLHPGPDMERIGREEHDQRLKNATEALRRISRKCRELAMDLALENMLPHLVLGQAGDIRAIIRSLKPQEVGTCLDTGHAHLSGNLFGTLYDFGSDLRIVHTNDNKGKWDDHLPPGKGHIEWVRLFSALQEVHYRGPLILELNADGAAEKTLAQGREAVELMRKEMKI